MERLGKYEIVEKIGEGGFGIVYKGRDPYLKRVVAIKTCTSDDEGLRKRFLREAEVVGTLHHPNVTMVHDFGYEGDVPYLVQEFLTGEDLSALISREQDLSEHRKLDILLQAARGLQHAHEHGIVHRDVKPNNIRVLEDGKVKVMDFGIAKLAQLETRLTKTGMSIGTAAYMAPEQLSGDQQDHRCDIFAFGAMAYELLAYKRPFDGETMSRIVFQILYEQPKPIAEHQKLPFAAAEVDRLVARCMAKDPAQRYDSFVEVIAELERLTGMGATRQQPVVARAATGEATTLLEKPAATAITQTPTAAAAPAAPPSPAPSKRFLVPALAGGGVLVAVVVGWLLVGRGGTAPATAVAPAPVPAAPPPAPAPAPTPSAAATAPAPTPPVAVEAPPQTAPQVLRPGPAAAPASPSRTPSRPAPQREPASPPAPVAAAPPPAAEPAPPVTPPVQAPAPAPAPAAPPPRPSGPSPEDEVRALLRSYESAYESLDARAVRAVWPGLGEQRQRDLQRAFDAYRTLELELNDCSIAVTGETAQASCRMRQTFQPKVGEGARRESPITFRLRRQGEVWRIESTGG